MVFFERKLTTPLLSPSRLWYLAGSEWFAVGVDLLQCPKWLEGQGSMWENGGQRWIRMSVGTWAEIWAVRDESGMIFDDFWDDFGVEIFFWMLSWVGWRYFGIFWKILKLICFGMRIFPYVPIPSASGFGLWVKRVPKHFLTGYLEH